MENKTDFQPRGAKIVEDLRSGRSWQLRRRFYFNNEFSINDHINSLSSEQIAFVEDGYVHFTADFMSPREKFTLKGKNIKVFEETETQDAINFEKRVDDGVCESFLEKLAASHGSESRRSSVQCIINFTPVVSFSSVVSLDPLDPDQPCVLDASTVVYYQ